MGEIKSWKDWFRNWNNDRFQLFSDVMVKSITFIYFIIYNSIYKIWFYHWYYQNTIVIH